ncbi:MAG: TniB family NTP-binding protein [Aliishimia sp.]
MSFVDFEAAQIIRDLRGAHYQFPRAEHLHAAIAEMRCRYYAEAGLVDDFEARGTLVVGPSRIGKTFEVDHQRKLFNEGADEMPDDRPAKMVKVMLRESSSWKELGVLTLRSLGYKKEGRGAVNQTEIWNQVMFHAEANGVVAIHYDECQHIFIRRSAEIQNKIRGCFKSLLKQPEWPLMLIFSGVDELKRHIMCEEQLGNLVKTVTFVEIDPGKEIDLSEMNSICFAYADKVGLDFSTLSSADFHQRLAFACSNRWGLVIELMILPAVIAKKAKSTSMELTNFCQAFTNRFELQPGYSLFSLNGYKQHFDADAIFRLGTQMDPG